jgi:hypothetical protein
MKNFLKLYTLSYSRSLICMLQNSEYDIKKYLDLVSKTKDFTKFSRKYQIHKTNTNRLLLLYLRCGMAVQILAGLVLVYLGLKNSLAGGVYFGLAVIASFPILWAYLLALFLTLGH